MQNRKPEWMLPDWVTEERKWRRGELDLPDGYDDDI
jgi:hypothetical protein